MSNNIAESHGSVSDRLQNTLRVDSVSTYLSLTLEKISGERVIIMVPACLNVNGGVDRRWDNI